MTDCKRLQDLAAIERAGLAWRRTTPDLLDATPAARWQVVGWRAVGGANKPRAGAWAHPTHPHVIVRHCGHPTALRPYYVAGLLDQLGTFSRLGMVQACAEALLLQDLL